MGLKGKTVIQLHDAKTGKLTDEISKSNLVTNALNNVLNGGLNAIAASLWNENENVRRYSIDYLYKLPSGSNIAKSLLGGVLVFSKSIQEDVEHCIPTIDEMKSFIGCANQHATTTGSIFRGSINESESEIGDNYIKFVWEFTSEQCNGDIASICLTSDIGGSIGYKFNVKNSISEAQSLTWLYDGMWDTNTAPNYSDAESNNKLIHNPMYCNKSGHLCSYIYDNNLYCIGEDKKVYKYNIYEVLNKNGSDISDSFTLGKSLSYVEAIQLDSNKVYITQCLDSDKVYYYCGDDDKNIFPLRRISKNAVVELINIPVTNILASIKEYCNFNNDLYYLFKSKNCFIYKDKIYIIVGWVNNSDLNIKPNKIRIYILSFDGSFTFKDMNLSNNGNSMLKMLFGNKTYASDENSYDGYYDSGIRFMVMFDNLVLEASDGTNGFAHYLVSDDVDVDEYPFMLTQDRLFYYGSNLYKNSGWLKEPWCSFMIGRPYLHDWYGNGYQNLNVQAGVNTVEMIAPYLATINNQDTVLTKTSDKTMKIIYTLTKE